MITWGGYNNRIFFDNGGRYNPETNSWTPISAAGTLAGRRYHVAVWTGTEMIVWGGSVNGNQFSNTGARYNPTSDRWTTISNAPTSGRGAT
jgi:hypothetical protein